MTIKCEEKFIRDGRQSVAVGITRALVKGEKERDAIAQRYHLATTLPQSVKWDNDELHCSGVVLIIEKDVL